MRRAGGSPAGAGEAVLGRTHLKLTHSFGVLVRRDCQFSGEALLQVPIFWVCLLERV